jgi:hypothetical protein
LAGFFHGREEITVLCCIKMEQSNFFESSSPSHFLNTDTLKTRFVLQILTSFQILISLSWFYTPNIVWTSAKMKMFKEFLFFLSTKNFVLGLKNYI